MRFVCVSRDFPPWFLGQFCRLADECLRPGGTIIIGEFKESGIHRIAKKTGQMPDHPHFPDSEELQQFFTGMHPFTYDGPIEVTGLEDFFFDVFRKPACY